MACPPVVHTRQFMNHPLSRRHFLSALGLAAGSAGWNTGGAALAGLAPTRRAGGPRLKTALNAYSFSKLLNDHVKGRGAGMTLLQLCDFCARHDFDAVDLTGYFFPGYPEVPADNVLFEVKRRAFDLGLDISGTGVRNNFTTADKALRAEGVRHIQQWVEAAARLGAPVLRVFADTQMKSQSWQTASAGATREQVEEWIAADLRTCAQQAAKFGVIIGVQNHGDFLQTGTEHLSLIQRVDSPWCGPIVDTGYYKSADPYADMAQVAPFAVNWQIKESPFGAGHAVRTDLPRLLTLIQLAGYRGYLPIETLSAAGAEYDPFKVVPAFLAELRAAMEATSAVAPPTAPEESYPAPSATSAKPARKPPNKKKARPLPPQ